MTGLFFLTLIALVVVVVLWQRDRTTRSQEFEKELVARQNLQHTLTRLETLHERFMQWTLQVHKTPRPELPAVLIDAVAALSGAQTILFLQQHPVELDWRAAAARGLPPEVLKDLRIDAHDGLPRQAAVQQLLTGSPKNVVLRGEESVVGVLAIAQPANERFPEETLRLIEILCGQAAQILSRTRLSEEFHDAYAQAAAMLGRAVEAKDACTFAHLARTKLLVRSVAEEMHLPQAWVRHIEQGGYLHDLGKLGIPDAILNKPGPLTAEEYTVIKKHPGIGRRILEAAPYMDPASWIVLYHHEWFNGQGYPEGLAGGEIPLGARIVQVVDAWDAMTSDRPYRKAMSKSAAVTELRRQAGTQFDPKIVETFLKVIERLEREGVATTEEKPRDGVHA